AASWKNSGSIPGPRRPCTRYAPGTERTPRERRFRWPSPLHRFVGSATGLETGQLHIEPTLGGPRFVHNRKTHTTQILTCHFGHHRVLPGGGAPLPVL